MKGALAVATTRNARKKKASRKRNDSKKTDAKKRTYKPYKNVVIVESPVKRKMIGWMLGDNYRVVATGGHFRSLFNRTPYQEPPGKETWNMRGIQERDVAEIKKEITEFLKVHPKRKSSEPLYPETNYGRYLGVDVEEGYEPWYYVTKPSQLDYIREAVKLLPKNGKVYLATDPDREGEGIAWHLEQMLDDDLPQGGQFRRMVFHAVTKKDVVEAVKKAKPHLDEGLVSAYRSREVLDQVVGYTTSRALWFLGIKGKHISLSLGRVQMAALELLMRDEEKTLQTVPNLGHKVGFALRADRITFEGSATTDEPLRNKTQFKREVAGRPSTVTSFSSKTEDKWPRPAHTLAAFQQDMYFNEKVRAKEALRLAQYLFEAGVISYPRTDSPSLSAGAFWPLKDAAKKLKLKARSAPPTFSSKRANAQEAHEALHPKKGKLFDLMVEYLKKDPTRKKDFAQWVNGKIKGFNVKALRAYEIIFRRALAASLLPAKLETRRAELANPALPDSSIVAESKKLKVAGWYAIWPYYNPETKHRLPVLKKGQKVKTAVDSVENYVQPLYRPSAQDLVSKLDELDIGRPSSTASMLETLERRGYVSRGMSRFGAFVTSLAREAYKSSLALDLTVEMDRRLNELAASGDEFGYATDELLNRFLEPVLDSLESSRDLAHRVGGGLKKLDAYFDATRNKLGIIAGLGLSRDGKLLELLNQTHPVLEWYGHGSLLYATETITDDSGFALLIWRSDEGVRIRLYYLYPNEEGIPMVGMVSSLVAPKKTPLKRVLNIYRGLIEGLDGKPLSYLDAWLRFINWVKKSPDGQFDLDGFFPTMRQVEGSNSIQALVFWSEDDE